MLTCNRNANFDRRRTDSDDGGRLRLVPTVCAMYVDRHIIDIVCRKMFLPLTQSSVNRPIAVLSSHVSEK